MNTSIADGIEQVLDAYAEAKNRHDVEAAVALCHPDGYYESVGMPGRFQGREALIAFYTNFFALLPDYQAEFEGRAITADTAVVWGRFTGTVSTPLFEEAPLGCRVEVPVTFVCTFRDGLVYSDVGYFDAASMFRQGGLKLPTVDAHLKAAAFVSRFAKHWSAPEPEQFRDLLDPETRNLYPGMTEAVGADGIIDWIKNGLQMFPDLSLEVTRWATDGDAVLIEFDASATLAGRPISWQGADRFTLKDDRCIEGRSYFDTALLRQALSNPSADGG